MTDLIKELEIEEILQKLKENGFGNVVEAFLSNEGKVYTKKGRLNKSGACRVLNLKAKGLEEQFKEMRKLIAPDMIKEKSEIKKYIEDTTL